MVERAVADALVALTGLQTQRDADRVLEQQDRDAARIAAAQRSNRAERESVIKGHITVWTEQAVRINLNYVGG